MKIQEPSPLGAETRALIEAARGGHEPNELGRARVRRGVEVKLAAGVGLALVPASSALAGAAKITLVVATLTTVVGAGIYALPHRAPRPEPTHATAPIARRAPAPAERPAPIVAPATLAPAPAPRRHAHVAVAPVDNTSALAQETALLGAANTALAHRDVASALALLDDYDHRARPGILVEERAVTGVLAFCAAGRVDAARAEARRFRARWPRSPLAARVDGSCVAQGRPPASLP